MIIPIRHIKKTFIISKMWNFKNSKIQNIYTWKFKNSKLQECFTTYINGV
jgi:hypothetical protein